MENDCIPHEGKWDKDLLLEPTNDINVQSTNSTYIDTDFPHDSTSTGSKKDNVTW